MFNMKRFALISIIISILLGTVGCSNEKLTNNLGINNPEPIPTISVVENETKEIINPTKDARNQIDTSAKKDNPIKKAKDISTFVPQGWHILEKNDGKLAKVEGDLNKDSVNDIAFVIEGNTQPEEPEPEMVWGPPRSLLIAFGNKDNTYSLSIKSDDSIMLREQGGVFGDPFDDIVIDRGSLLLKFYGGSNWRWYRNYRFRFQNEGWYLIGATFGSYYTGTTTMDNADEEDYNYLTGDYIIKKSDEKGKLITSKGNRGKRELLNLKDFGKFSDEDEFLQND